MKNKCEICEFCGEEFCPMTPKCRDCGTSDTIESILGMIALIFIAAIVIKMLVN